MHRTLSLTVPPAATANLARELAALDEVVCLSVTAGASLKPPGDVLTLQVLNRGMDKVLRCVADHQQDGTISATTAELASIIDSQHAEAVANDVDEAIWEEMEAGLRHQGRVTANFLALMAAGGVVAAVGLVSTDTPQAIAFVAASVIAPGFEPLVKIPLGLVLRRWAVVRLGLVSASAGYVTLILAAALTFLCLWVAGGVELKEFVDNPEVYRLEHPTAKDLVVSGAAALAGAVIVSAFRRSVIAGPLIALVTIHAAAAVGVALVVGRFDLAGGALQRLGLDIVLILPLCAAVFALKQAFVHQRRPLV